MKMKLSISISTIIIIMAVFWVSAEPHSLSLQSALERAARDNPLVRIERINTSVACAIVSELEAVYGEPRLRASYTVSERENRPIEKSHDFSVSVADSYSTGTAIEAGLSASPYSSALRSDKNFQNTVGVTVTQALLQGRGSAANLIQIKRAKVDVQIRHEELAAYAMRLLADTERAYWDLLFSGEQIAIYKHSLELAQRLLYESEERLKIGGIAPIDLVAIRAEVASRERQLFDAETAYRQRALYLLYLMNAADLVDAELALTDTVNAATGGADPVADHLEAARMFRPDYLVAFMQAQKGELELEQTKNGLLPKLDFFITLQGMTPAETFPGAILPAHNGSITGAVAGGLTLSLPIKNTAAKERHRRTGYTVEQQKISIDNFLRQIDYEIRSAHIEVERARRQIETAKTVGALQRQKLEAEQEKMDAGKSTSYAVLQVQRDLVMASLDEAQARTAYVGALITLYSRDGTFLQRRGVKF